MKTTLVAAVLAMGVMIGSAAPVFAQYTFGAPSAGAGAGQSAPTQAAPNQGR